MEKIELLEISKGKYRSMYKFPKEQKFFEIFRNILLKLGFEPRDKVLGFGRPWDQKDHFPIMEKEDKIEEWDQIVINFSSKHYSIDIAFFLEEVATIFNYREDRQQEIAKVLEDFVLEDK